MNRREFLVKAGIGTAGLVLTVSSLKSSAFGASFEDVTVPIAADSALAKVGGSQVIDTAAGKVIIVHVDKDKFAAFSAKCTHKGGIVDYDAGAKQLVCPKHGSKFDGATGDVTKGPADQSLKAFPAKSGGDSVVVSVS